MIYGFSGQKESGKNAAAKIWLLLDEFYNGATSEITKKLMAGDLAPVHWHMYSDRYTFINKFWNSTETWGKYRVQSFAAPLKNILAQVLGTTEDSFDQDDFKKSPVTAGIYEGTVRTLMQDYAKSLKQFFGDDVFLELFKRNMKGSNILVTDIRFLNEAALITEKGGKVIKIMRKGKDKDKDVSETEWMLIRPDYQIDNNGTFKEFVDKICNIMKLENIIKDEQFY